MYAKCGILMMDETEHEKPLFWIGGSYGDLLACPPEVRRTFGFAQGLAQHGGKFVNAKPLKGFGGAGVLEVVEDWHSATFSLCLLRQIRRGGVCAAHFPEEV